MDSTYADARRVMERCDILSHYSEEPDRLTRRFATPALREAQDAVAGWMRDAGMGAVRRDNVGNLSGRYEARAAGAKTLLLGSHLDTVRDAGKYDGPLGVLVALALVERLHARHVRLPFAIDVVAFADEESLRYHTCYLGSASVAGAFNARDLVLVDDDGVTMAAAIHAFGGDPAAIATDARRSDELLGYCEVHIEQGPVLERLGRPVGVVSAIMGQSRVTIDFVGQAGHAGTVPMDARHDALCAAAEFVLAVEGVGRATEGLVATVGQVAIQPGASNVIPGAARLSLDVRHGDDARRAEACRLLQRQAIDMGRERGVAVHWQAAQESPTTSCDDALTQTLTTAIAARGYDVTSLPSGAGHDAVALSNLTRAAMLFVRCKGGVSHNPAESISTDDVAVAIAVMDDFLTLLARS